MIGVWSIWLFLVGLIALYDSNFYSSLKTGNYNVNVWCSPFECGFIGHNVKVNSFSAGFFLLLVFFVIFDLEISLLLNCVFQEEFFKNLIYYLFFLVIVALAFLFEVVNGFVGWYN
uniref:NADH-ubiquinone oxidoreductase chain 3 n=1 Tax=Enterogyrus malmbergi TaxID=2593014 RepID=A0A6M3R5B9_9PLAT|nr:NADH dehydrogenase subunit 3 [Enterogyrus malmbergi]QJD07096.1 NADH dehydrogenase subunit 3 [Enterogyrus malmbergi]